MSVFQKTYRQWFEQASAQPWWFNLCPGQMDFAGLDSMGDMGLIWETFWTKYYVHVSDCWETELRKASTPFGREQVPSALGVCPYVPCLYSIPYPAVPRHSAPFCFTSGHLQLSATAKTHLPCFS